MYLNIMAWTQEALETSTTIGHNGEYSNLGSWSLLVEEEKMTI